MYENLSNTKNTTDFILIGVGILFVSLFLVIVYYGLFSNSYKTVVTKNNTKPTNVPPPPRRNNNTPSGFEKVNGSANQVFHVKDNVFTYDDAEAVCKAYGADLATYQQLVDAYKKGANWCSKGWVKGQMALFPVQYSHWKKLQESGDDNERISCGVEAGINGGYHQNKNLQFGVNCYGEKRGPVGDEKMKQEYLTNKERELQQKIAMFQKQLGNFRLAPFNENKWGSCPSN
tara:strand:- start:19 stop:711 length:693 start_codon:yes stop_codon:yes gene_type:complete